MTGRVAACCFALAALQNEQMKKIWAICGTPTKETWPHHDKLPVLLSTLPPAACS